MTDGWASFASALKEFPKLRHLHCKIHVIKNILGIFSHCKVSSDFLHQLKGSLYQMVASSKQSIFDAYLIDIQNFLRSNQNITERRLLRSLEYW